MSPWEVVSVWPLKSAIKLWASCWYFPKPSEYGSCLQIPNFVSKMFAFVLETGSTTFFLFCTYLVSSWQLPRTSMEVYTYVCGSKNTFFKAVLLLPWNYVLLPWKHVDASVGGNRSFHQLLSTGACLHNNIRWRRPRSPVLPYRLPPTTWFRLKVTRYTGFWLLL